MNAQGVSSSAALELAVTKHLLQDECLVWCGRPRHGRVLRAIDIVLIPFSVFACIFFGAWSYFAIRYFPIPLKFLSILAVGFAFYLAYGRFLLDARRRLNTIYAVTDKRCLWISEDEQSLEKALAHQSDRELSLTDLGSVGTIAFGKKNGLANAYARAMGLGKVKNASDEFEMIDGARCVRDTISALASRSEE